MDAGESGMVAVDEVKAVVVDRGHDVDVLLGGGFGHGDGDGFAFLWVARWKMSSREFSEALFERYLTHYKIEI